MPEQPKAAKPTTPTKPPKDPSTGHFTGGVPQDTNKNGTAGRPSSYTDAKLQTANAWLADHIKGKTIAWLEELCIKLDIVEDTMWHWCTDVDDNGNLKHREFSETIKKAMQYQKLVLKNNGISGKFNSRMTMFLLSANHNVIEKREVKQDVLSGGKPISMAGMPVASDEGVNEFITQGLKQKYKTPDR